MRIIENFPKVTEECNGTLTVVVSDDAYGPHFYIDLDNGIRFRFLLSNEELIMLGCFCCKQTEIA